MFLCLPADGDSAAGPLYPPLLICVGGDTVGGGVGGDRGRVLGVGLVRVGQLVSGAIVASERNRASRN